MRPFFAWSLWVIALLAAVVTALDKTSIISVAKGTDMGVTHDRFGPPPGLWLKQDWGGPDCYVRIQVRDQSGNPVSPTALECKVSNSTQKLGPELNQRDPSWLEIKDVAGGLLQWTPGGELTLQCKDPKVRELRLLDWEVQPKKEQTPHDSLGRAAFRSWWYWGSFLVLLVSAIYTFVGFPLKDQGEKPVTRQDVIRSITGFYLIGQINGANPQETQLMRRLLHLRLLEEKRDPVAEDIWQGTPYQDPKDRQTLWFQTFNLFNQVRYQYDPKAAVPILP